MNMPDRCQRCFKETNCLIMSMFNTQMICISCKEKEEKHPKYQEAREKEAKAIKSGNYNYPGIGKPSDL